MIDTAIPADEAGQLSRALAALRAVTGIEGGVLPQAQTGQAAAAAILLHIAGRALRYQCAVRRKVDRYGLLSDLAQRSAGAGRTLLVSAPLSAEMAERCRELGLEFIDTAGNVFLSDPGIYIYVAGRRAPDEPRTARSTDDAGIPPAALRMMFAFLASPALLGASYRELAAQAGVSTGVIGKAFDVLQARGLIGVEADGRRRILQPEQFLNDWAGGYLGRLKPRLARRRFATEDFDRWSPAQGRSAWGGEVAAAYLTKLLQPRTATVYLDMRDPALLPAMVEQFGLREQADGHVEVLEMFWDPASFGAWFPTVPPHLVYADLLDSGELRHVPAARQLAQQVIERLRPKR